MRQSIDTNTHNGDHTRPGGNIQTITRVTADAARIMNGKCSDEDVIQIHRYGYRSALTNTRKWLDSLDPQGVYMAMQASENWHDRYKILDISHKFCQHLVPTEDTIFTQIVSIVVRGYIRYNPTSRFDNVFRIIDSCRPGNLANVSSRIPEFITFFDTFVDILPAFHDGDFDKRESMLENAWDNNCWQNYFLYLKLVQARGRTALHWVYEDTFIDIFGALSPEDIILVASISTSNSPGILNKYVDTKERFGKDHIAIWTKIRDLLPNNHSRKAIIHAMDHGWNFYGIIGGSSDPKKESFGESMSDLEFIVEFGRNLVGTIDSGDISSLIRLKHTLKDTPLQQPQIFAILQSIGSSHLGDYVHPISFHRMSLPEMDVLKGYLLEVEDLAKEKNISTRSRNASFLSYLLRYGAIPGSIQSLRVFVEAHPQSDIVPIVDSIFGKYEQNWETNPLYTKALSMDLRPQDNLGIDSDFQSGVHFFIQLVRAGLSMDECDRLYDTLSGSKDLWTLIISKIRKNALKSDDDIFAFASVIHLRPKKFYKVFKDLAYIFRESARKLSLSDFIDHKLWNRLSDKEIKNLTGDSVGSYEDQITKLATLLGKNTEEYRDLIDGFKKSSKIYPDIREKSTHLHKFESALLALKIEYMQQKVCDFFAKKIGFKSGELTVEMLKDESIYTVMLQVLSSEYRKNNRPIGCKLLRAVIHTWKNHQDLRFADTLPKNISWIKKNLTREQATIWKDANTRTYDIDIELRKTDESIGREINKNLSIAQDILEKLGYAGKVDCSEHTRFLEELPIFLQAISSISPGDKRDLNLQAHNIERILRRGAARSVKTVKVYHEHNTRRSIMMGDWVDGSCLASYSGIGNGWSTITNVSEINKGIWYAEDEKGNVVGRILLAIDTDKKLVVFPVYTRGSPDVDLEKIFQLYVTEFAEQMNLAIGGDPKKVEKILGLDWYTDPVWNWQDIENEEK